MAELEHDLDVQATYYVMARSPFYNPFSHAGQRAVRRITELGHALGVHCDLDTPRESSVGPVEASETAARDHTLLRSEFPTITRRLSFHCPPRGLLWHEIPGFDSAYAPAWEARYKADSGHATAPMQGRFAYGDPEDTSARPLQVNLHAEHWFPTDDAHDDGFWR